jgi:ferric-dicitrate binding protein FerR (iron transport regulator)
MKANQNISDKDWELIAKSIYDENSSIASEEHSDVIEELLPDKSERNQLLNLTKKVDIYFDLKKYPEQNAWNKIESRIHNKQSSRKSVIRTLFLNPAIRVAAAVLFVALLTFSGYETYINFMDSGVLTEVTAGNQKLTTVYLPDGTTVSLNSDTKLTYPREFNGKTREVSFEGEAFFEVKPDKNKPFIIHAGQAQIKVLGTSFNVNAYPQNEQVEVVVETGRVQVLDQMTETQKTNELILTPGDKGTLVYSSHSLQKTANQNPNYLSWKTRNLTFKATSLSEVTTELEKVYKVSIRLADPKLSGLLLTAQFNDYSLDFILKVIENTFQLEVEHDSGQYILKVRS